MTSSTAHIVRLPDGTAATRNSKTHVYTFAVVTWSTTEELEARLVQNRAYRLESIARFEARVAAGEAKDWELQNQAIFLERTADRAVQDASELESVKANGGKRYGVANWCGRRDLAEKAAARLFSNRTLILPVESTSK